MGKAIHLSKAESDDGISHTMFFVYKNNVCEMPSSDSAFERVCIWPLFDVNRHYTVN
jgi:hypothetical protein